MLFADVITDPSVAALKSLTDHWPWLTLLGLMFGWLAKWVLIPATKRHIDFLDAMEGRERKRLANDITMGAALAGISEKLSEHGSKLSSIKDFTTKSQCEARDLIYARQHPHEEKKC